MNHPIDSDPQISASTLPSTLSLSKGPREDSKHLKLLETLIDKIIKRLEDNSCQPKIRDALKAIQLREKVAKTSDAEKIFWELIGSIRTSELSKLSPQPTSLEAQIQVTILSLKDLVKNGILPLKTVTDVFNQARSKQGRLTYHRMGRLLSAMGFTKAKTPNGCSAIIWDDQLLQDESFLKTHPLTHRIPAGRKAEKNENELQKAQKAQKRQYRRLNRGPPPLAVGLLLFL